MAAMVNPDSTVTVTACGAERAEDVQRLTHAAYALYAELDPPTHGRTESLDVVRADLESGGGAIAGINGPAVGCLRWVLLDDGDLYARRVAVEPESQGEGVGRALMGWAEEEARRRGCAGVQVGVRIALEGNLAFFAGLGYEVIDERTHVGCTVPTYRLLRKALCSGASSNDAQDARFMAFNPAARMSAPAKAHKEMWFLHLDEVETLVAATPERWRAFIVLAVWTGMRFGEIAALRASRVDFLRRQVASRGFGHRGQRQAAYGLDED
jgi:GNAT superfamily N-acetyltransferase